METEANQIALVETIRNGDAVGLSPNRYIIRPYKPAEPYVYKPGPRNYTDAAVGPQRTFTYGISDGKLTPGMLQYYRLRERTTKQEFQGICERHKFTIYDEIPLSTGRSIEQTIESRIDSIVMSYRNMLRYKNYENDPYMNVSRMSDEFAAYYRQRDPVGYSRVLQQEQAAYWRAIEENHRKLVEPTSRSKKQTNGIAVNLVHTERIRNAMMSIQKLDDETLCMWVKANVNNSTQRALILADIEHSQKNGFVRKTYQLLTPAQREKLIEHINDE